VIVPDWYGTPRAASPRAIFVPAPARAVIASIVIQSVDSVCCHRISIVGLIAIAMLVC
jgi:hypothetical protein